MKLYIAEKPSLGRAIATAMAKKLAKPNKNHKTHIELANGDVVSWCVGHILTQAEPHDYDEKFSKWSMESLPIIPQQWQLKPIATTRAQLAILRKLVKQADAIIHAGDPDREGQLLIDEVIDYLKVATSKKTMMKRLLISDLNVTAVLRSLNSLKDNKDFIPLSVSALARSRADWLYGINLTRAYTLQGKKQGYHRVLSVGRVQTPVLGLVVRRDNEIASFVSKSFYQVDASIYMDKSSSKDGCFTAKWQPSEACLPYCDAEGRVLVQALAENVVNRIKDQPAIVENFTEEPKKQRQPLPFNLSNLQIAAAKQFSMNAKLVLDVCQSLYEKHKLITYPRSDCRYLPKEQLKQASNILNQLANTSLPCQEQARNADSSIISKAWNDKKITAHHAIVPTEKKPTEVLIKSLNAFEKNIYLLIIRQYLAQFYPVYEYQESKVELNIAGGIFTAQTKKESSLGWKVLFPVRENNEDKSRKTFPPLKRGQALYCHHGELIEKKTAPPESFTDATLLSAMTGISRFVKDSNIKKILKETDGLGTDATRAGIIDLLFKRDFLKRQGKKIIATDIGRTLINGLPEQSTLPDMTAQWEATLNDISEKRATYLSFMSPLVNTVTEFVHAAECQPFEGLPKVAFKPKRAKRKYNKKSSFKKAS